MAFVIGDRVRETSTTTGTGSFTLAGAVTGYQTFDAVLDTSDTTYYTIADQSGANFEVGIGTFTAPATLARTTILSSSNGGSVVTFGAGTKDVFISLPASKTIQSFSAGSTGLTPSTASFGAVSLAGTLVPANGGTGTATAFTAGSVVFAGASGVYAQDNTNLFFDDTNNRLGIGTSSPSYQLTIQGTGQETANLTDAGNKGGSLFLRATGVASGSGGAVLFGTTFGNQTPFAAIKGFVTDGTTNTIGDLTFSTRNAIADTSLTERMRITSSGNVGIGTTAPGGNLHVNSSSGAAVSLVQAPAGSTAWLGLLGNGSSFLSGDFNLFHDGTQAGINMRANLPMIFSTNNTERMRIDSSGNLLVGTTTAAGKITVDGTVTLTNQAYAYYAQSGGAAVTGYATGQNVGVSIWTSDRVSSTEFNARSDGRLKKDITPIPVSDAWHFINNVPPIHYKWIKSIDDGHKFGFVAQDLVKAGFSHLVAQYPDASSQEVTDADGFTSPAGVTLTVNYDQIVPVLSVALRDAMSQINDLKARLTALETK